MKMLPPPRVGLAISIVPMVVSAILIFTVGLTPGVDFTGGSLLEASGEASAAPQVGTVLKEKYDLEATVQPTQDGTLIIRLPEITNDTHQAILETLRAEDLIEEELRFEVIGPTIGAELRRKAWTAVSLAVVVLLAYLTYTFRQMKGVISSWKFGVATVLATLHDILVVAACFTLLGRYFGATVDTLFVTALLAVLGYSVNDTIVLFSRFLQEWRIARGEPFMDVLDRAARATLLRSLNTSLAIMLVLVILLIFGGTSIRWFIVALTLGTVVGTYSSMYVAPFILYYLARPRY
jgi:preprotein translocase SecF subunit